MFIIGIAGGSGSGKSAIVRKLQESFSEKEIAILPQDSYYFDNSHLNLEKRQEVNYDHPDSVEFDLLISHLNDLKSNLPVSQPLYSYIDCARLAESKTILPAKVIIVEGILVFTNNNLRNLMNLKIFVDTQPDERLMRIIKRDTIKRGKTLTEVINRYHCTVQPMHEKFIEPSKKHANIIIPHGAKNDPAVEMLVNYIKSQLHQ